MIVNNIDKNSWNILLIFKILIIFWIKSILKLLNNFFVRESIISSSLQ